MGEMMPFLLMSEIEAARLAEATLGEDERLEPRRIAGGPRAGQYALPRRVLCDAAFAQHRDAFALMPEAALDPALCWPDPAEGEQG